MQVLRTLMLTTALVAAGALFAEEKKPAAASLEGKWTLTAGTKDGAKVEKTGEEMIVTKEKITLKTPEATFEFSYKIDLKAKPGTLDLEILAPDAFKGGKAKGIVSVEGDTAKLAYHPMGGERPKDFDAKKGTGEFSFTMKRAKEEKKKE